MKKNRKLNKRDDVIGERLRWPSEWARLLSLDFFNCPSAYQLFPNIKKSLSAMTFGGTSTQHNETVQRRSWEASRALPC